MTRRTLRRLALAAFALCATLGVLGTARAADPLRAPAYPLIANDPYFSVWSSTDKLADSFPVHWTGKVNALVSLVQIDGQNFRIMGAPVVKGQSPEPMTQTNVSVRATNTVYTFADAGIEITLTFTTPNLPDDLMILSRPATYLTWRVKATDGKEHDVRLYFDATAELCVDNDEQKVAGKREATGALDVLKLGTETQEVLAKSGDNLRIDWGYFYAAAEKGASTNVLAAADVARASFLKDGSLPTQDDDAYPRAANDAWPVVAFAFDCGKVGATPATKRVIVAYDDEFCMTWLGEKLRPYWRKDGETALGMLDLANAQYSDLMARCQKFDEELWKRAAEKGGEKYASLCSIAYPEAIAAHKLALLPNGKMIFISKEHFSGGCAGTVDVLYPGAPLFIVYNTELLKATLTPIMEYTIARWPWPYAPHDLGFYPLLEGQIYGGGEKTEERQMPVEESANMLILFDVVARLEGNVDYALEYWDLLKQWADYLLDKGFDPENQLCTDDFMGHLAHNVNLSAKATVALACYADLCERAGKTEDAKKLRATAEEFVQNWVKLADNGDHYRLAFDQPDTWSMKYNLVWDKLLDLKLFPKEVVEKELKYYDVVVKPYGLPLDNRSDYAKIDWEVWTATLADSREGFDKLMTPVYDFVDATQPRVPMTDWYFASDAKMKGFRARSVVGGVFIKFLEK